MKRFGSCQKYRKDVLGRDNYEWFDDEEEFENRVREVKANKYPCTNIEAIEIGSCRDINVDELQVQFGKLNSKQTQSIWRIYIQMLFYCKEMEELL